MLRYSRGAQQLQQSAEANNLNRHALVTGSRHTICQECVFSCRHNLRLLPILKNPPIYPRSGQDSKPDTDAPQSISTLRAPPPGSGFASLLFLHIFFHSSNLTDVPHVDFCSTCVTLCFYLSVSSSPLCVWMSWSWSRVKFNKLLPVFREKENFPDSCVEFG